MRRPCGQTEAGAVGENRRQERWDIGRWVAGAQMREAVGEAGPAVDVTQHLGDPHTRQHTVQSQGQIARGIRNERWNPGDVEFSVFDLDAVEFTTRGQVGNKIEAFVQHCSTSRDVAGRIGLTADAGILNGLGRQQVVLEGAVIAAAGDPDAAAFQAVTQRREHSGFVKPPICFAVREDQLAPFRRQEC